MLFKARFNTFWSSLAPISRAVSRIRFARSSSDMMFFRFFAGIGRSSIKPPWAIRSGLVRVRRRSYLKFAIPAKIPVSGSTYHRALDHFDLFVAEAIRAYPMRWCAGAHRRLQHLGQNSPSQIRQFILLLLTFPCFRASYFFFKLAYFFNQRRLLRLGGKDFFREIYNRRAPSGSVIDILDGLRHIEHGLKRVGTCLEGGGHFR